MSMEPGGQQSQFDGPYSSVQMANVIAFGITYSLATVVVGLRYFQAVKLIKKIEINLGIICACVMRFKSLIRTYLPQFQIFSSSSQSGKKQSKGLSTEGLRMDRIDAQDSCQLHSFHKRRTSLVSHDKDTKKYQSHKTDKGARSVDGDSADEIWA